MFNEIQKYNIREIYQEFKRKDWDYSIQDDHERLSHIEKCFERLLKTLVEDDK